MQLESQLLETELFKTAGDRIPFTVNLDGIETLEIKQINEQPLEGGRYKFDELCEMGTEYLEKFIYSILAKDLGVMPKKVEQLMEINRFRLKNLKKFRQLTERETEILGLLANGYNNPMIAECLYISRYTVETHRKNIKRKLDICNCRDLIKYAFAFNLIEPERENTQS